VVGRINQLLKPGGVFISATPCLGEKAFLSILMNIPIFLLSRVGVIPPITFFSASRLTAAFTNAGFQMIEQKDLSVRPLRECFIVARKAWKAENHPSVSLVVPDAHRHVVQGHKKGNVVITAGITHREQGEKK
jgi:2-polyprenyl-3-methyl-5-hydroxy-6-metoxy-1,4-benzoquinol methylase